MRSRPINAPGFAGDIPALGSAPRRGTRPKRRPEDANGLGKGKFIRFGTCHNRNVAYMLVLVRKRRRAPGRRRAWRQGERARRKWS
jgi:hypothetical protein